MEKRNTLFEDIVQRIGVIFGRTVAEVPETDSSIETQKQDIDAPDFQTRGTFAWYEDNVKIEHDRLSKYGEYDRLDDETVEISSALDIYADNATSGDSGTNDVIEIVSEDESIIEILEEVKTRLNLDFELRSIARELVKYGDCFEEVVVYDDLEVHRLKHLNAETMQIVMDEYGRKDIKHPYIQVDKMRSVTAQFEEWQVLHFKLQKGRDSAYGVDGSLLCSIRKVAKQLAMVEDSVVIARLTRAQQRFAYMIDVNGVEPGEATVQYLEEVKNKLKKKRTIDPRTGKMDLNYNPLSVEEDIFLAKRESGGSDVKVLQGATNLAQLQDIEYFRNKLFAGLKVPKAWLGLEADTRARAVITELDVQFARTIRRVQQAMISELRKLFDFVLTIRGIDTTQVNYTLRLPILSMIDEMRTWQMELLKASVAKVYKGDLGVSSEWVYKNLLGMSDEDIDEIKDAFGDEASMDNVRADSAIAIMAKQNTSMLNIPALGDAGDAGATGEDGSVKTATEAAEQSPNGVLTPRDIKLLRYQLGEELNTLYELLGWEYEYRTGKNLPDNRKMG